MGSWGKKPYAVNFKVQTIIFRKLSVGCDRGVTKGLTQAPNGLFLQRQVGDTCERFYEGEFYTMLY